MVVINSLSLVKSSIHLLLGKHRAVYCYTVNVINLILTDASLCSWSASRSSQVMPQRAVRKRWRLVLLMTLIIWRTSFITDQSRPSSVTMLRFVNCIKQDGCVCISLSLSLTLSCVFKQVDQKTQTHTCTHMFNTGLNILFQSGSQMTQNRICMLTY